MVSNGRFRSDLYYRLNVIPLHILPLRQRREDIIPLANHLLQGIAEDSSLPEIHIGPGAGEILKNYHWPGNAREISNVLERAASSLEEDTIHARDLPFHLCREYCDPDDSIRSSLTEVADRAEKKAIREALSVTENNKARAAALLGIHRTLLYKKMKKYGFSLG